jgi:hypothetical protein
MVFCVGRVYGADGAVRLEEWQKEQENEDENLSSYLMNLRKTEDTRIGKTKH